MGKTIDNIDGALYIVREALDPIVAAAASIIENEISTLTAERDELKQEVELWKKVVVEILKNPLTCHIDTMCFGKNISCGSEECLELHKQAAKGDKGDE